MAAKNGDGVMLGALMPHPPLLIPDVGGADIKRVEQTRESMRRIGEMVKDVDPEALVIISPHAPLAQDAITILAYEELKGDFGNFGAPQVKLAAQNDMELVRAIQREAQKAGIPTLALDEKVALRHPGARSLDHGTLVPLYYLREAGVQAPIVVMGFAFMAPVELYVFGKAVADAAARLGRRTCVIASGDLSHRLMPGAPAGYDPEGKAFDQKIVSMLGEADVRGILTIDPILLERAGECGYRSIAILLGAMEGFELKTQVLSYEGPFGVGYGTCILSPGAESPSRRFVAEFMAERRHSIQEIRERESYPVRLAREAVEEYVQFETILEPPSEVPREFSGRAGVFCSIKKHGELRGCIGTIQATQESIVREIIRNAIAAACEDPRFPPVQSYELGDLVYSVDILSPPERIGSPDELDPKRYGVIVRKGARSGLLLPDLEGVDDVATQLSIAKRKAGIASEEDDVELYRFEVTRYQ